MLQSLRPEDSLLGTQAPQEILGSNPKNISREQKVGLAGEYAEHINNGCFQHIVCFEAARLGSKRRVGCAVRAARGPRCCVVFSKCLEPQILGSEDEQESGLRVTAQLYGSCGPTRRCAGSTAKRGSVSRFKDCFIISRF